MKFLCVECDEAMRLEGASGPDRGSMTVVFACPSCGRRTAMLTNSMETQVVRSLGVKIGGRTVPAEPMEMVRGSLVGSRFDGPSEAESKLSAEPSHGTPKFDDAASVSRAEASAPEGAHPASHLPSKDHAQEASKCPFTGMVNDAFEKQESVVWTEGARLRMERIPEFARRMVMKGVEEAARAKGHEEVTEAVLDDVRGQFGM